MDTERPSHRSTGGHNSNNTTSSTSELFICFTSRLSSSSMKISSKSILSPGRARDSSHLSSSSSLSRRLKNSGSLKGGQGQASPMFPTVGKKRGCAFENPEPSSPKVTCIGQVRVKTKKQSKKMRLRSKRCQGEVMSFRSNSTLKRSHSLHHHHQQQQECLPHRNQRWVHLPVTICEALRAVGSEFNCFLPCRSSCMSSSAGEKDSKSVRSGHEGSCGAVLARWIMSLHEGDVKGRDIEFVVGEDEEDEEEELHEKSSNRSRRRHVFEDIEINEDDKFEQGKENEAKVNICVPPKNALLLMRCRSDPVKMEALASRFCESKVTKDEDVEEENEDCDCVETGKEVQVRTEIVVYENCEETQVVEENAEDKTEERPEVVKEEAEQTASVSVLSSTDETHFCDEAEIPESQEIGKQEIESTQQSSEQDESESLTTTEELFLQEEDSEPSLCTSFLASLLHSESDSGEEEEDKEHHEQQNQEQTEVEAMAQVDPDEFFEPKAGPDEFLEPESDPGPDEFLEPESDPSPDKCLETESHPEQKPGQQSQGLPDCLVLMMREPKLSMEVSKETWVCSTDFIQRLPARQVTDKTKSNGSDKQQHKNRLSIDSVPSKRSVQQPPRSSCHYPSSVSAGLGAEPVGSVIEQKLVGCSKAYETFVLTRCKSEPMRNSDKFVKLEAHGIGF